MAEQRRIIHFYGERNEFGWLSNFSSHSIFLKGKRWPTVEHYFQAQKFAGTDNEEIVRQSATPALAKKLGRQLGPLRQDWEDVKESIMINALFAKFTQDSDLKKALLETGDAMLIEHTKNDRYWGDGGDGSGKNRLGFCLELVRSEIRAK